MEDELLLEVLFLRYFYSHADFGPAGSDVRMIIQKRYEFDTGREVPDWYKEEY